MTITYTIQIVKKSLKFKDASTFYEYIKANKLPKGTMIILTDENGNNAGTISVEKYLLFDKLGKPK